MRWCKNDPDLLRILRMREVATPRSRFLLCELSETDPAYPKYPPQPVVRCEGHQPKQDSDQKK